MEMNNRELITEEESLGGRIRKRRLQLGMTLHDLVVASSLTKSFVSHIGALQLHRTYNPGKDTAVVISAITPPAF